MVKVFVSSLIVNPEVDLQLFLLERKLLWSAYVGVKGTAAATQREDIGLKQVTIGARASVRG